MSVPVLTLPASPSVLFSSYIDVYSVTLTQFVNWRRSLEFSQWLVTHSSKNPFKMLVNCWSINVKPNWGWGGRTQTNVGHLTSIAFPTLRNLSLHPRVGTFDFLPRRNDTNANHNITKHHPVDLAFTTRCHWPLICARGLSTPQAVVSLVIHLGVSLAVQFLYEVGLLTPPPI